MLDVVVVVLLVVACSPLISFSPVSRHSEQCSTRHRGMPTSSWGWRIVCTCGSRNRSEAFGAGMRGREPWRNHLRISRIRCIRHGRTWKVGSRHPSHRTPRSTLPKDDTSKNHVPIIPMLNASHFLPIVYLDSAG